MHQSENNSVWSTELPNLRPEHHELPSVVPSVSICPGMTPQQLSVRVGGRLCLPLAVPWASRRVQLLVVYSSYTAGSSLNNKGLGKKPGRGGGV